MEKHIELGKAHCVISPFGDTKFLDAINYFLSSLFCSKYMKTFVLNSVYNLFQRFSSPDLPMTRVVITGVTVCVLVETVPPEFVSREQVGLLALVEGIGCIYMLNLRWKAHRGDLFRIASLQSAC